MANTMYKHTTVQAKKLRKQAGLWLRGLRLDAELTQLELAKRVGQEWYTYISQIENGNNRVPPTDYDKWAAALGVKQSDFAKTLLSYYDPATYKAIFGAEHEQRGKSGGKA
jgi:transcriptional regulator with XRE-family HTH domain